MIEGTTAAELAIVAIGWYWLMVNSISRYNS